MRRLFLAASFAAFASYLYADEAKKADDPPAAKKPAPPKKPEVTLKVGDPAPTLKADKWLQGSEVAAFAPDKVYVVEFWATWCGPCIVMMPHMAEMQAEYRDKGVTFIGFSAKDPTNTEEKVAEFVKKRGPKLGYTFAYGDNREIYTAWMTAAGQGGIPCSFVIDKAGKIAYIGHPMYLDYVLPKVVAGQWSEDDANAIKDIEKKINETFRAINDKDPEVGLKALAELDAKYPWAKNVPYFIVPKITRLALAKKNDEACQMAKDVLAKAQSHEDTALLGSLAYSLRSPDMKENKELLNVAVSAAEANVKLLGETDFNAVSNATETHFAAGDKAKATAYAAKAIAAAKLTYHISSLLNSPVVKDNKELLAEVLKAAEAQLKDAGESNYMALMNVADAHFALGDRAKAKEFGAKAVAAAKIPALKANLEKRVAKYDEEKKEDK
jgi:thiol-disulfide isomerase/thioredoxin